MCSTNNGALVPFGIKVPSAAGAFAAYHPSMTQAAFDFHRAQLYDYNARLHYGLARAYPAHGLAPYHPNPHDPLSHPFFQAKFDPRTRLVHEEPKPQHSYIGLIAMGILSHKDQKMVLADIYQWILDNYAYFRHRGPGWRNSIRHNLSLNDCFIKSGRSANGKGHYWAIHPANIEDFKKGDFRRRKAQRRVRKHMGLSIPDDEDSPSPLPPSNAADPAEWRARVLGEGDAEKEESGKAYSPGDDGLTCHRTVTPEGVAHAEDNNASPGGAARNPPSGGKKRLFDVESLLAPDEERTENPCKVVKLEPVMVQRAESERVNAEESEDELIDVDSKDDDMIGNDQNNTIRSDGGEEEEEEGEHRGCEDAERERLSPLGRNEGSHPGTPNSPSLDRRSPSPVRCEGIVVPREAVGFPGGRSPWAAPLTVGTYGPGDHPSAFHTATQSTVTAWSSLPPHGFPIMSAPYPLPAHGTTPAEALAAQQRWQETFSRIMARSYDKNLKTERLEAS